MTVPPFSQRTPEGFQHFTLVTQPTSRKERPQRQCPPDTASRVVAIPLPSPVRLLPTTAEDLAIARANAACWRRLYSVVLVDVSTGGVSGVWRCRRPRAADRYRR